MQEAFDMLKRIPLLEIERQDAAILKTLAELHENGGITQKQFGAMKQIIAQEQFVEVK